MLEFIGWIALGVAVGFVAGFCACIGYVIYSYRVGP